MNDSASHGNARADRTGTPPGDSFVVSRAEDGDCLLLIPGSDLDAALSVVVTVRDGVLRVSQRDAAGGERVALSGPLDADGRSFLACLPRLDVVEVYPGPTEDDFRFERFEPQGVSLTYEGRGVDGR